VVRLTERAWLDARRQFRCGVQIFLYHRTMTSWWETFRNAGAVSWWILLVAVVALPLALTALAASLAKVKRVWVSLLVFSSLAACTFGLLFGPAGAALGIHTVEIAVSGESIDPGQKMRILYEGYSEAQCAYKVALFFLSVPSVAALAALGALVLRKREDPLPTYVLGLGLLPLLLVLVNVGGVVKANPYPNLSDAEAELVSIDANLKEPFGRTMTCAALFTWVEEKKTTRLPSTIASTLDLQKSIELCVDHYIVTPPDIVRQPIEKWKQIYPGKPEPHTGYEVFEKSSYLKTLIPSGKREQLSQASAAYRAWRVAAARRP
jgi:hypothetical protein